MVEVPVMVVGSPLHIDNAVQPPVNDRQSQRLESGASVRVITVLLLVLVILEYSAGLQC